MSKVFLSYRRDGGEAMATILYRELTYRGFTVFYDIESLTSGLFDIRLLEQIEKCDDFILILPKGALDRCVNPNDWVRQEIVHAIKTNKNIVPVMLRGFDFPADLPKEISQIVKYNAVSFDSMNYFDARMEHLISYLHKDENIKDVTPKVATVAKRKRVTKRKFKNPLKKVIQLLFSIKTKRESTIYDGVFTTYGGSGSYLSIPVGVTKIYSGAFSWYNAGYQITRISIPSTVLSLDSGALFSDCTLKAIDLPDSLISIGASTFYGCESLKKINIPAGVTYIGDNCFSRCISLKKITIPDGILEIGNTVFYGCTMLSCVNIPASVKEIKTKAFANCNSLTSINFDGTVKEWDDIKKADDWDDSTPKYTVCCTDGIIEKQ